MNKLTDLLKSKQQLEQEIAKENQRLVDEEARIRNEEAEKNAQLWERTQQTIYYNQVVEASKLFAQHIDEALLKDPKFLLFLLGIIQYSREQNFDRRNLNFFLQRVIGMYKENQIQKEK